MPRKADFAAKAAIRGVDDLSLPWAKAVKRAEKIAGRSFGKIERMGRRMTRGVRRGMQGVGKGAELAGRGMRKAQSAAGTFLKTAGGLTAVGALAVDQYGKFELSVARLGNLLDDDVDAVEEYGGELKKLAVQLGTDPIETAEAAYMAFSGGVETSKKALLEFLPAAGKAAKAGATDMATAVDAATSVLNVFGDTGIKAGDVFDKLFVTERLGKTDFGQIAGNIGQVAAFAKEMGVSFDEVLAPMASITKTGVQTGEAFTQMSSIIAGVVNPTDKAKKAFKKLKLPFGADAIKQAGGLVPLLTRIKDVAAEKGPGVFTQIFGRKEAIKGAIRLTGSGFEDMVQTLQALENSAGTADAKFANVEKRTGFRIQQMKTGFKALVGELGGGIAEGLGLDKIGNVPEATERAGKKMRSAAKNFAQGFLQALSPGKDLSELDFDELARDAGKSFGSIVTMLGKAATGFANLVGTVIEAGKAVSDFADAAFAGKAVENPADRAQAKTEAKATFTSERQDPRDFISQGLFGGAAQAQGRTKLIEQNFDPSKSELLSAGEFQAELLKRQRRQREQRKKRGEAGFANHFVGTGRMARNSVAAPSAQSLTIPGLVDKLRGQSAASGKTEVGGKIEVEIKDKTAAKSVDVKATSKNKAVPVTAKVGKRKVGG